MRDRVLLLLVLFTGGPFYNETGMNKDATERLYVPALCSKRKEGLDTEEKFME